MGILHQAGRFVDRRTEAGATLQAGDQEGNDRRRNRFGGVLDIDSLRSRRVFRESWLPGRGAWLLALVHADR
jgi:hypothetical protein